MKIKRKLKQAILISLMVILAIILGNDYYTIFTTAQHNWAWYMNNRQHIGIELFTISFLFLGCMVGLVLV